MFYRATPKGLSIESAIASFTPTLYLNPNLNPDGNLEHIGLLSVSVKVKVKEC
jgi:hypothetical protein